MGKTAFIFPGQGAQVCGMGQDFYEQTKTGKEIFDKASELLGLSVPELCFEKNDRLDITEYTQAAMVTVCTAMLRVLEEEGYGADMTAGLSLGEYCALEAADAMSFDDAVLTVRRRGILMQEAVPAGVGGMRAVLGMDAGEIDRVVNQIPNVQVANYNCPGQIVISGLKEAVEEASEMLKEAGARRILPLNVSGPFHSYLLEEAGRKLGDFLDDIQVARPKIPYVANVTAGFVTKAEEIKPLLIRQVSSSVKWQQSVEAMIEAGVDRFVEIGPGRTLSGFIKKINRDVTVLNIEKLEDLEKLGSR